MAENPDISVKDKKKNIDTLFNKIAKRYDFLNHLLTLNIDKFWRKQTVKLLERNTENVLDIATGTGDLAIEIMKQRRIKKLIGADISENMLNIGKKKIDKFLQSLPNKDNLPDVSLILADVNNLPFNDNEFNAVTCAFGVRNFYDLNRGLKEMHRVLTPQGQIVILEFAYPKNLFIRFFYTLYFTYILPLIGKIISKDNTAYKYLMQSVKAFPKNEEFLLHLKNCGFKDTKFKKLTLGIANIYTARKID